MKRSFALSLLGTSLAASALHAADAAPTPAPETAGFHLKNRSSFTSPETARPPFWPVGWIKHVGGSTAAVAAEPVAPEVRLDPDQFAVTSILLGHPSLAVINGKPYIEGEYLRTARGAKSAAQPAASAGPKIQVQKIQDGVVILAAANQAVTVPLKRPRLSDHKADDDPIIPVNER